VKRAGALLLLTVCAPFVEPPIHDAGQTILDAGSEDAGTDAGQVIVEPPLDPIPDTVVPCEHPEYWPLALQSPRFPFTIHFRAQSERAQAERVQGYLENSWHVEVEQLGFRPPLPDAARCGADERFDIFLWRGMESCYVDVLADNTATPWDDQFAYLVVDPWGPYGGDILDATIAHEFNHACQAADDWYDAPAIYEMTAVLMEEAVYDDDNGFRTAVAPDFQSRPDWSIDRDDNYDTWFMYGASLYLMYLRDKYFEGGYSWAPQMWLGMREKNYVDALEPLLAAKGTHFIDTVTDFERWRWYTGANDDGHHLREASLLPAVTVSSGHRVNVAQTISLSPAPMLLGSTYIELERQSTDPSTVQVSFAPASTSSARRWMVQAVPGLDGADGEIISGTATLRFPASNKRTLIITPVPTGAYDPDARTDTRYAGTLTVTP
jgi:hypothetical protein